jgi:hypothetical protein
MDQQLRLGRVILEDTQANHQQVTIDLVFQGNDVKPGIEFYGIWKDRTEGSICPFVLNENGEADFGSGYGGDDRIYQFEILSAPIGLGHQIGWRSDQYDTKLKIISITQLV